MQSTSSAPPKKQNINKMQQPSQQYVPSANQQNGSGNVRQQQPIYRGNPPAPVPRHNLRHNNTMMAQQLFTPTMQPVLMPFHQQPYTQRTVQFPPPQYTQFQYTQLQSPFSAQQYIFQNAPIIQTSNVNSVQAGTTGNAQHRGVINANIVQTSSSQILTGPNDGSNQNQIITPSGIITQATAATAPTQVGGVQVTGNPQSMVGGVVMGSGQPPMESDLNTGTKKRRKHTLKIIDPATNKDVLADYINTKGGGGGGASSNTEPEYQPETHSVKSVSVSSDTPIYDVSSIPPPEVSEPHKNVTTISYQTKPVEEAPPSIVQHNKIEIDKSQHDLNKVKVVVPNQHQVPDVSTIQNRPPPPITQQQIQHNPQVTQNQPPVHQPTHQNLKTSNVANTPAPQQQQQVKSQVVSQTQTRNNTGQKQQPAVRAATNTTSNPTTELKSDTFDNNKNVESNLPPKSDHNILKENENIEKNKNPNPTNTKNTKNTPVSSSYSLQNPQKSGNPQSKQVYEETKKQSVGTVTSAVPENVTEINVITTDSENNKVSMTNIEKTEEKNNENKNIEVNKEIDSKKGSNNNEKNETNEANKENIKNKKTNTSRNNKNEQTDIKEENVKPDNDSANPKTTESSANVKKSSEVPSSNKNVHYETEDKKSTETSDKEGDNAKKIETSTDISGDSVKASSDAATKLLISYNDGQWSPQNRDGNKVYDRKQLLSLRQAPLSNIKPQVDGKAAQILLSNTRSPQPNLMPQFARSNSNNKRNQSMGNPMPSGSIGPTFLKNHSTSVVNPKNNAKGSKSGTIFISLSLREDVKLNETENAWKPSHLVNEGMTEEERAKEVLKRKVRGILNKLTPEKFDPLVDQIMKLQIDNVEKVNEVMILVFEKAIDEPNFSNSYAKLCDRLAKEVQIKNDKASTTKNLTVFRNALLDKTEHEFTDNVTNQESKEKRLRPIKEKLKECTDPDLKIELQAQLEEEERKIRRRSGGTVRFIGELFKLSMLTGNIIRTCISHLLDVSSEDKLECLCKLLTTVGEKYEKTHDPKNKGKSFSLDNVIRDMQNIVDRKDGNKISSRIRFMLQDVIDLRKNNWLSTKTEVPKTMDQIQKEAKTEQISNQMSFSSTGIGGSSGFGSGNSSQSSSNTNKKDNDAGGGRNRGYGNSGGPNTSRGGGGNDYYNKNRNNNQMGQDGDTWYTQTAKGKAVDANKLGQMSNFNYDMDIGTKLGTSSQFQWNMNSTQRSMGSGTTSSTTSNSFAALSNLDSNKNNSGSRNKGSFNKGSIERDRYGSSHHGSRESSSSRNQPSNMNRNDMNERQKTMERDIDSRSSDRDRFSSAAGGGGGGFNVPKIPSQSSSSSSSTTTTTTATTLSTKSSLKQTPINEKNYLIPLSASPLDFEDEFMSCIKKIVDIHTEAGVTDEIFKIIEDIPEKHRWTLFYFILFNYLHLRDVKQTQRKALADITEQLFKLNYININDLKKGVEEFSPFAYDVSIDTPLAWQYIFEYFGPLIYNKIININDIWNDALKEEGPKFLKHFILYCTKEIGPKFLQQYWKKQNLKWSDYIEKDEIDHFIKENKFEYVDSPDNCPYEVIKQEDTQKILNRVKELLNAHSSKDSIIDYLSANIKTSNKQFIRGLTTHLLDYCILNVKNSYKLDEQRYHDICHPLLQRYIDNKPEFELECLYAIQILINNLEHPQGLLVEIFDHLYDQDIVNQDSFYLWRDSKEEPTGKGVAVKALTSFFNDIICGESNGESSEENN